MINIREIYRFCVFSTSVIFSSGVGYQLRIKSVGIPDSVNTLLTFLYLCLFIYSCTTTVSAETYITLLVTGLHLDAHVCLALMGLAERVL
jgi:hypothetical protein